MIRWPRRWLVTLVAVMAVCCVAAPGSSEPTPTGTRTTPAHPLGHADLVVVQLAAPALNLAAPSKSPRLRRLAVIRALRARADRAQQPVADTLRTWQRAGLVSGVRRLWITPEIRVRATPAMVRRLSALPGVRAVIPDEIRLTPAGPAAPLGTPAANQEAIGSPTVWAAGQTGSGVVVASLDTGVDATHPDLIGRWRGGADSWFDPFGEHPAAPTDLDGHGTGVTGVMVAGDSSGQVLGVAPDAQWIAARVFDDAGHSSVTATHLAFQWLLDPDGDPLTADQPDVVNASWSIGAGPGCDLTFQPDVQALRAAGIVTVFPAGNFGPGAETSVSPANYPESLSVGALNTNGSVRAESSRGPSGCGGRARAFPDLVAPGQDVATTDRWELFQVQSGSSVAAPHVAGVLALLLGARPALTPDALQGLVQSTAHDLGDPGPDESSGSGLVDAAAAYGALPPSPDFAISTTANAIPLVAGGSATAPVSVTALDGFVGDVALRVETPLDSGVLASVAPDAVAGAGSAEVRLSAAATAPAAAVTVRVVGTSAGVTREALLSVEVSVPAPILEVSTTGNVVVPGVPGPGDDADVYAWNGVSWRRSFAARAAGLPARADVDGWCRVGSKVYVSFADGITLPGVGWAPDEDVFVYDGTTWQRWFDGSRHGLGGSGGDVDAVWVRSGVLLFSTRGDVLPTGTRGVGDDADVYSFVRGRARRWWDASAHGLPGSADVDGLARSGAGYLMSFGTDTPVPSLGVVADEDIVAWQPSGWAVHFAGAGAGLGAAPGLNVDAFSVL